MEKNGLKLTIMVNKNDLLEKVASIPLSKKGYKGTTILYNALINGIGSKTLETRSDYNLGHLFESWIKAYILDYDDGYYSRANSVDLRKGRLNIEIKVSANCYDLSTPLTKATKTYFVSEKGIVELTKKTLKELFSNPYDFQDYVKIEDKGLRLKPKAYDLGKPITMLNTVLGF